MTVTKRNRGPLLVIVVLALTALGLLVARRRAAGPGGGPGGTTAARPSIFAPDPGEDRKAATGVIEGVVEDPAAHTVDGAIVVLTKARGPDTPPYLPMRPSGTAVTASGGRFRFAGLSGGEYGLTAMAAGFAPGERSPVTVTLDAPARVEVTLAAGGLALSGRVLDAGGGVIPGAIVRAIGYTGGGRIPRFFQAVSDDTGTYKLIIAKGSYGLSAEAQGYAPMRDGITLGRDETRDLRLMPAARLYGRVVERSTRQPVPDAEVWVTTDRRNDIPAPRDVKTDEAGNFAFNDLPPGTFAVAARKARLVGYSKMVAVSAMQAVTDIEVEVDPGLTVRGRVVDRQDKPLPGVRLNLYKREPPFDRGTWAKSEPDGSFSLEGTVTGAYTLSVSHDGFAPARKEVKVAGKDVDGVVVKLAPGASVSGVVVGGDGKPAAGAQVTAEIMVKMGEGRMFTGRSERADPDGKFEIKDIEPSQVSLRAKHEEMGSGTLDPFPVAEGEKKTVKLVLGGGASIAGRVRYEDGSPASGMRVTGMQRGSVGMFRSVDDVSVADGSYKLTGLSKGDVDLGVRRDNGGQPSNKTVALGDGEHKTGVDLEIPKANLKISGQVVAPDGKPVVGATLTLGLESQSGRAFRGGGQSQRAYLSGEDGSFTIEDVPKGMYTVWAFHSSHPEGEAKGVEAGTTGLRIQLPAESAIAGTVAGADGQPVADYTVTLLPGPADKESPLDRNRRLQMGAFENPVRRVHDPAGAFAFDRLKAGAYELKVSTSDGRSGSQVVTLQAAEKKTGVRITLAAGVKIVGRVLDAETGDPLPGASVSAYAMANPSRGDPARVDAQGAFTLENVPSDQPLRLSVAVDGYVTDGREIDPPRGKTVVDVGAIKLIHGDMDQVFGAPAGSRGVHGMGVTNREGHAVVSAVGKGTPAEKAGLKVGEAVLSIDGRNVRELGPTSLNYLMAGKPGSSVTVEVAPEGGGEPRKVTLSRVDAATIKH